MNKLVIDINNVYSLFSIFISFNIFLTKTKQDTIVSVIINAIKIENSNFELNSPQNKLIVIVIKE